MNMFLSFSFSGLFGSNVKEASPKRSIPSSNTKQNLTTDQTAPQNNEKFE